MTGPNNILPSLLAKADISDAEKMLKEKGVEVSAPVVHEWMNAVSLYFDDLDGNALELIALRTID